MIATVPCTVGIFAHNEEANIAHLLQIMLEQDLEKVEIREIIVVSSGSTDQTDSIVRQFGQKDRRIRLLVQAKRQGKASAINLFLKHQTIIQPGSNIKYLSFPRGIVIFHINCYQLTVGHSIDDLLFH